MDFLRPLLMPLLIVTIVASVWCMGWAQQLDAEAERASRPRECPMAVADAMDEAD